MSSYVQQLVARIEGKSKIDGPNLSGASILQSNDSGAVAERIAKISDAQSREGTEFSNSNLTIEINEPKVSKIDTIIDPLNPMDRIERGEGTTMGLTTNAAIRNRNEGESRNPPGGASLPERANNESLAETSQSPAKRVAPNVSEECSNGVKKVKRRKTIDVSESNGGPAIGTILQSWKKITAIHKELRQTIPVETQPINKARRTAGGRPTNSVFTNATSRPVRDTSGGILAAVDSAEVGTSYSDGHPSRKRPLGQHVLQRRRDSESCISNKQNVVSKKPSMNVSGNASELPVVTTHYLSHNVSKSSETNDLSSSNHVSSLKSTNDSNTSLKKPITKSFIQPKCPPCRNGDGAFVRPSGRGPTGYTWDPFSGLWVVAKNGSHPDDAAKTLSLARPSGVNKKRSYRYLDNGRLKPLVPLRHRGDGTFERPLGRPPVGFVWDHIVGEWCPSNEVNGSNALEAYESIDTANGRKGNSSANNAISNLESHPNITSFQSMNPFYSSQKNEISKAFIQPKSPPLRNSDGTFVRPLGRSPVGYFWDQILGLWVVSENENQSDYAAKTPSGVNKKRNYTVLDNGRLRPLIQLRRRSDGSFERPLGRPPVGFVWNGKVGEWCQPNDVSGSDSLDDDGESDDAANEARRNNMMSNSSSLNTAFVDTGVHATNPSFKSMTAANSSLLKQMSKPFLQPKSPPLQNLDGTFVRPLGRSPVGYCWDPSSGLWVVAQIGTQLDDGSKPTSSSRLSGVNKKRKFISLDNGRLKPLVPLQQRGDESFERPRGRPPVGFSWDDKAGEWSPLNEVNASTVVDGACESVDAVSEAESDGSSISPINDSGSIASSHSDKSLVDTSASRTERSRFRPRMLPRTSIDVSTRSLDQQRISGKDSNAESGPETTVNSNYENHISKYDSDVDAPDGASEDRNPQNLPEFGQSGSVLHSGSEAVSSAVIDELSTFQKDGKRTKAHHISDLDRLDRILHKGGGTSSGVVADDGEKGEPQENGAANPSKKELPSESNGGEPLSKFQEESSEQMPAPNRQPRFSPRRFPDGTFQRPRGIAPVGAVWNPETGEWIASSFSNDKFVAIENDNGHSKSDQIIRKGTDMSSLFAADNSNAEGNHQPPFSPRRTPDGKFQRPRGRAPVGSVWKPESGEWVGSRDVEEGRGHAKPRNMSDDASPSLLRNGSKTLAEKAVASLSEKIAGDCSSQDELHATISTEDHERLAAQKAFYVEGISDERKTLTQSPSDVSTINTVFPRKYVACGGCSRCTKGTDCGTCLNCVLMADYDNHFQSSCQHPPAFHVTLRPVCALRICLQPVLNLENRDNVSSIEGSLKASGSKEDCEPQIPSLVAAESFHISGASRDSSFLEDDANTTCVENHNIVGAVELKTIKSPQSDAVGIRETFKSDTADVTKAVESGNPHAGES